MENIENIIVSEFKNTGHYRQEIRDGGLLEFTPMEIKGNFEFGDAREITIEGIDFLRKNIKYLIDSNTTLSIYYYNNCYTIIIEYYDFRKVIGCFCQHHDKSETSSYSYKHFMYKSIEYLKEILEKIKNFPIENITEKQNPNLNFYSKVLNYSTNLSNFISIKNNKIKVDKLLRYIILNTKECKKVKLDNVEIILKNTTCFNVLEYFTGNFKVEANEKIIETFNLFNVCANEDVLIKAKKIRFKKEQEEKAQQDLKKLIAEEENKIIILKKLLK